MDTLCTQSLFFTAAAISRSFQSRPRSPQSATAEPAGRLRRSPRGSAPPGAPLPLGPVTAEGGATAGGVEFRPAPPPPLGTRRLPRPRLGKLLAEPPKRRAAGGRAEGAPGAGGGAVTPPVPCPPRHVPAPRPIAGRRRPGSEQAVARDGGDRRCFRARPRRRSWRLRRRRRGPRQRRRRRGPPSGGKPSCAGRASGP